MRYLLLICDDLEPQRPEEVLADPKHATWLEAVTRGGAFQAGGQLRPGREASSVRVRGGQTLVSDGPFAETKDLIGGVVLVECATMAEAIEIAAGHPVAAHGTIEVRPIWEA